MIANILAAYGLKKSAGAYFFTRVTDAAGDHWITVHPNGPGTKGQPVLLSKGGEIKGGMGGKFNGMHISSAQGSQGDPLTRGNMELQRSKWIAAHPAPAKPTASAHVKVPEGLKRTTPAYREGEDDTWISISLHGTRFRVPRSEVTTTKAGTLTHVSPRLLKWVEEFPQRHTTKLKNAMRLTSASPDEASRELERIYKFNTPEIEREEAKQRVKETNFENERIAKGKYKGNAGFEEEKKQLEYWKNAIKNNANQSSNVEIRNYVLASAMAETLEKDIAKREKQRKTGFIKQQYEQLSLF